YAQRYNAAGTPQGSEFKVNTTTANNQSDPAIAMDADSDFVVSWASNSQDGSLYGIYAQRYNAAGTPQGSEFRVNTYTTNNQDSPAIAMAADGDFVLSWASKLQDGSLNGIYAQRFAAPVDLSLTGTQSTDPTPGYAQVNGSVTYSYGLQNLHNSESAHRVEIFFNLPPAFSYDTFSGADWSCVNTPPLTCSYGPTLAPGATAETLDLTLNMPATPIKADVIANSFSTQSETNAANNSSVLRTIVCDTGATDSIKVSSLSVSEAAGLVSVGVTRSGGACSAAAVNYATSNGTATAGSDYTAVSGTLNWAATEQGEKTVMVPVTQDALHEGQETITLALSSGGSGGSATLGAPGKITILDDDPLPTVRLSTGNKSITEAGISATITATLSALSGRRVTVPFTRSGTAVLDSDYLLSDTTLVIPAGRLSASLTLVGKNDALDEDDETAIVTMGTPLNATATAPISNTITILDDDPVPTVSLSTGNQSVSEAGGSATVTATLSALSGRNVTVPVARSGKAKFNSDYFLSPTTIVIPAGGLSASMTLVGKDDAFDEAYETAILTMSTPLNASATGTTSNTITIDDDDAPPTVAFVTARSNVTEGSANAGQSVTVMLSAPSGKAVSVSVKQIGGIVPGTDYSMVNGGNIKIPAGANTAASVMVLDDTEAETDEQVRFELSAPVNATLGTKTTHSLTIVDND
ncbi:MAG: Calx-beta domain-containing protein, partial [Stagnimonas sp.]|nr:Calx-beta domain-containing protein [Stagnimonas sp.]